MAKNNNRLENTKRQSSWRLITTLSVFAVLAAVYYGFGADDVQQYTAVSEAKNIKSGKSRPAAWAGVDDLFHSNPFGSNVTDSSPNSDVSEAAGYEAALFDAKSFIKNLDKLYARFQQGDVEAALLIANRLQDCSSSKKLSRPAPAIDLSSISMPESFTREQAQAIKCDGFYDVHWGRFSEIHNALLASQHPTYVMSSLVKVLAGDLVESSFHQTSPDEVKAYIEMVQGFAQSGHPQALPLLAELYASGEFVSQDLPKSIAYQMVSSADWSLPLDELLKVTSTHQYSDENMEAAVKDNLKSIYESCCFGKNKNRLL